MKSFLKKYQLTFIFSGILLLAIFFRIYKLTEAPPALHGDELGVGYNAYSLLKTGRDEYGRLLPLTFRSDFTPVIFYATFPFISILGLTEFATRFPTALIGILTVPAVYYLVKELTQHQKLALLVMFLVSLSSWHIRTSRIALELTWALFFQKIAVSLFLRSLKYGKKNLIYSLFVFGLSIFSYHSTKMTTPLLALALIIIYRLEVRKFISKKHLIILFTFCIVIPILLYFYVQAFSQIRFVGISVFTLWKNSYPVGTRLLTLKPLSDLIIMISKNYLVHFDPRLLFLDNRSLRYFQLPNLGLFYLWQAPFIIIGFISLLRQVRLTNSSSAKLILFWFFLAPVPAALTTGVPFSNIGRVLLLLPVVELMTAYGIVAMLNNLIWKMLTVFCVSLSLAYLCTQYFSVMPKMTAAFWGTQWRDAAIFALNNEDKVNRIIFSNPAHQSYIYVLFYGKKDPVWLTSQEKTRALDIGFSQFQKYEFRAVDWEKDKLLPNSILIGSPSEIPSQPDFASNIYSPTGEILLRIAKTPLRK